jgi:hypothetical protein
MYLEILDTAIASSEKSNQIRRAARDSLPRVMSPCYESKMAAEARPFVIPLRLH